MSGTYSQEVRMNRLEWLPSYLQTYLHKILLGQNIVNTDALGVVDFIVLRELFLLLMSV